MPSQAKSTLKRKTFWLDDKLDRTIERLSVAEMRSWSSQCNVLLAEAVAARLFKEKPSQTRKK
jgi:hypothetical protein